MNDVASIETYLRNVKHRNSYDETGYEDVKTTLKIQKEAAKNGENAVLANHIWCLEQILEIQHLFAKAFFQIKDADYYKGWCTLEQVEIRFGFLEKHFDISSDEYYLSSILRHTEQFQSVFPYAIFLSPGMIHKRKSCMICKQPVSILNPCGHILGELYNGEMCTHRIDEIEPLEMSFVENPVQKYSVPFMKDDNGETIDQYNYSHVAYFAATLAKPFDGWELEHTTRRESHSFYRDVGRNDKCPCGSDKKYKKCCLRESGVLKKHIQIIHEVRPPENVPNFLASKESFPFK